MSFQWTTRPSAAWPDLAGAYAALIRRSVRTLADRRAPEIEAWMKSNAPWTDRTGNARQTLNTEVDDLAGSAVEIRLAHGMEYGIYLELAHGGNWAIIGPAIDHFAPIIWNDVLALLRP